jgi:putative membrane protein
MVIVLPIHASLSLWIWSWDPTVALGTLALAAGYLWLLRDGDPGLEWSPQARIYFAASLLTLFLALESPIDVGGDHYLFSLHILQHVLLAMVVPPLILLGLPERWLILSRLSVSPLIASVIFNFVLAAWHLPFLYETTLRNEPIHVLEHLSFLAVALLFWWPVLLPSNARGGISAAGKIAYLGFSGVPPTILGLVFILTPTVIYPFYAAAPRVTPMSALVDQMVAGLVMFGLGNVIYFLAIWIVFSRLDDKEATAGEVSAVTIESRATLKRQ